MSEINNIIEDFKFIREFIKNIKDKIFSWYGNLDLRESEVALIWMTIFAGVMIGVILFSKFFKFL